MNELDFNIAEAVDWFVEQHTDPYTLVEIDAAEAATWSAKLGVPFRRCYICDQTMNARVAGGVDKAALINAVLPDPGSTMAGDFGEILIYFYHASKALTLRAFGPKKWRLKQDRTKPAPYSDTVQFVLQSWPTPSENDMVMCAEVKTKSTAGASNPITSAIKDCEKDRTSRLAKTLVWLKERALIDGLGDTEIAHLDRFIHAIDVLSQNHTFSLQMPTGAGKTTLCETILFSHAAHNPNSVAILLVPYRSLAAELRGSLVRNLNAMGISSRCAYGGTVPTSDEVRDLDDVQVVVATPETLSGMLGVYAIRGRCKTSHVQQNDFCYL